MKFFIPTRNIYTPGPKWQQGAVSSFPYGIMAAAGAAADAALDTTITVGSISYDAEQITSTEFTTAFLYGFKHATDAAHPIVTTVSQSGSIGDNTYTDGGSTSRSVMYIGWSDTGVTGTPAAETDNIYFGLDGNAISDSDTTFTKIDYNGTEYTRSSRSAYTNPASTESCWQWDNVTPNGPESGSGIVFKVYI